MEEKILIKSEHYSLENYKKTVHWICGGLVALGFLCYIFNVGECRRWVDWNDHIRNRSLLNIMFFPGSFAGICIDSGIILFILYLLTNKLLSSYSITVTNTRIYGTTLFGKRVDLPLDSVSAVGTSLFKGIAVGSSSGRINFKFVKNQERIHAALSKLLRERQENKKTIVSEGIPSSGIADEIKKYKDLLDSGVITQEEFDAKKKHLLGL